jgi:uncharacterized membrane protein YhaH (DUF805 family)
MADVFISYSREDRPRADQVARGLQEMGLDVFWDNEIPPGHTWADYIEEKLVNTAVVIVLWSQHSVKSQWVREEARMGREKSRLIPVLLDGTPAPFGFGEVQAADLGAWDGSTSHPDWVRFSQAAYNRARQSPPPPRPQPAPPIAPPPAAAPAYAQASQSQSQSSAAASVAPKAGASPVDYVANCFRNYANGKGRARRLEYGFFMLFYYALAIVLAVLDMALFGFDPYYGTPNDGYALMLIGSLALLAPAIAVASRRAHDFGQSGWLAILTAIPYVGFVAAIVFAFIPGQPGANQYGPDPKAANVAETFS